MFNTDNQPEDFQPQPQQQSGANHGQMQAAESDRTPHNRSREDEMRDWQRGFAGSM